MASQIDHDFTCFIQGIQRQSDFIQPFITFEQVNHITGAVSRLEQEQKRIKRDLALQPMRCHNFSGQPTSALMGPNGPIDLDGHILTIETAWDIPESDVDALAHHLHLPPFEKDTPLEKKRERLQKYLGIIAGYEDDEDDEDDENDQGDSSGEEEFVDDGDGVVEENEYDEDEDEDWTDHRLD